jgi:hypothetical protein
MCNWFSDTLKPHNLLVPGTPERYPARPSGAAGDLLVFFLSPFLCCRLRCGGFQLTATAAILLSLLVRSVRVSGS